MKKVTERLLVFFIGVPAVVGIVLFLDFQNHLLLNIIVILFSAAGAVEFSSMLEKKQMYISKIKAFILGALAPAALALTINFSFFEEWIIPLLIMAGISWILLPIAFSSLAQIETAASRLAAGFSVLVYPGFFMYWLIKMTAWGANAGIVILIFLLIPLCSDASAWLTGTLLGKNNKGIIPASPNKSIAGFIGGIAGSIIISGGAALIVPHVFVSCIENIPHIVMTIILGICTGLASTLGDLAESAIKRSCDTKDSGNLMLGRGGILDSIDSIATSAPVFFVLYNVFFINS